MHLMVSKCSRVLFNHTLHGFILRFHTTYLFFPLLSVTQLLGIPRHLTAAKPVADLFIYLFIC